MLMNVFMSLYCAKLSYELQLQGEGPIDEMAELYARELQADGAPVVITYPGMVLGPPAGRQSGEATEGIENDVFSTCFSELAQQL